MSNEETPKPDHSANESKNDSTVQNPADTAQPADSPKTVDPVNIVATPITRSSVNVTAVQASNKGEGSMERRTFIKWLTVGWVAFAAIVTGYGTLVLRYLFPNVLFEPKQSFLAGFPD